MASWASTETKPAVVGAAGGLDPAHMGFSPSSLTEDFGVTSTTPPLAWSLNLDNHMLGS